MSNNNNRREKTMNKEERAEYKKQWDLDNKEKIADMIYEIRIQFSEIPEQVMVVLEKIESYAKANED